MSNLISQRYVPRLLNPLPERNAQQIIDGARRVLNEIGVECRSITIRRRLAALKGAREANDRIYYGEAAVDAVFESIRKFSTERRSATTASRGFSLGAPFCCLKIADAHTNTLREPAVEDSVRATRLLEALGVSVGVAPLAPTTGVPAELRNLSGLRIALLHSKGGRTLTNPPSPEQIPVACEMAAAVDRKAYAFLVCMISPLRFEDNLIDYYLKFRDRKDWQIGLAAGMPCVGSTSPMHFPGALIQSLAESIAVACCELALGGSVESIGLRSDPFDMRFATYVVGSPDYQLFDMACRAVLHTIDGYPSTSGALRSMAKLPDAQAATERAQTVLFQALQGARHFSSAGQVSMDEVFSFEQAIIDAEILAQVEHIVRGLPDCQRENAAVDEALDLIRQGCSKGNYIELDYTLDGYRDFFYSSDLFQYENADTWARMGSKTILQRAAQTVERVIASAPQYAVSEERVNAVNKIFDSYTRSNCF